MNVDTIDLGSLEPGSEEACGGCGLSYSVRLGDEDTGFCHDCAHTLLLRALAEIRDLRATLAETRSGQRWVSDAHPPWDQLVPCRRATVPVQIYCARRAASGYWFYPDGNLAPQPDEWLDEHGTTLHVNEVCAALAQREAELRRKHDRDKAAGFQGAADDAISMADGVRNAMQIVRGMAAFTEKPQ